MASIDELIEKPKSRSIDDLTKTPTEKPAPGIFDFIPKPVRTATKGALGAIAWPFERVSGAIATPLADINKARAEYIKRGEDMPYGAELGPLKKSAKTIGKSLVSWEMPEEATTIDEAVSEAYRDYYKTMMGKEPPGWLSSGAGVAADFLVTPFATGKVLTGIGKAAKATPIAQKISAARIPLWQTAKLGHRVKMAGRQGRAAELGKTIGKKEAVKLAKELSAKTGTKITPKAVKLRLQQMMRGSISQQEGLKRVANPVIEEFAHTATELRKLKLLPEETFLTKLPKKRVAQLLKQKQQLGSQIGKLKGRGKKIVSGKTGKELKRRFPGQAKKIQELEAKIAGIDEKLQASWHLGGEQYFPRIYESKEQERLARKILGYSTKRIRQVYAKKRGKIPFEVRKAMGEIKEPAYPVVKRLIQEGADIETAKLFRIADRKWASKMWAEGLHKKALPDTKAYGALRGKHLPKRIYDDVTEMVRIRGDFEGLYDSLIGGWKLGKVVWNPATHFRNMFSNSVLLDLSGTGHAQQAKLLAQLAKEIKGNTKEWQNIRKYFGRTTLATGELMDDLLKQVRTKDTGLRWAVNRINSRLSKISKKPAQIYEHEEIIAKGIKYLEQRNKGRTVIQSVKEGNKWLFDYGDLTRWEKLIARRIMPFYTFPRKAIPRVIEAAAKNPYTLAKYPLMAWTLQKYSMAKLEITDADYGKLQKTLPDYMKQGSYLLMPYRDANGDLRFLDWTYLIPWGNIAEIQSRGTMDVFFSNPMIQFVGDIQRNKSSFTDREIWKGTDTKQEKTYKGLEHFWKMATPSLSPKGLYWDKLKEAALGTPSKYGKKRLMPETVAHTVFGVRTQPIDVKQQKRWRHWEKQGKIKELKAKLRDIAIRRNKGNITDEEYKQRKKQYLGQIKDVVQNKD